MAETTPAVPEEKKKVSIANYMKIPAVSNQLDELMKDKKGAFVANMIALTTSSTDLAECDAAELYLCAMNATALNLPLSKELGLAYIVPYKNWKTKIVTPTFQIGKNGWRQLALRTGRYKHLISETVREGEIYRNKFTGELKFLKDNPEGAVVGYIASLTLLTGYEASIYMTVAELEEHAIRYVPSYKTDKAKGTKYSLWSDPIEVHKMREKTVFKRLIKECGVITTEVEEALDRESNVSHELAPSANRTIEATTIVDQKEPVDDVPEVDINDL